MNIEVVTPEGYKEKIWGKKEGGENIVDGYTFKGKNVLKKAKEGLDELLKKGLQSDVNGIKFKVMDRKIKGSGLEIDVKIEDRSERGIGILKLYGPNKKSKEYTVMVNKHKDSDVKFVTVLAEKVVKPLINQYIEGEEMILGNRTSTKKANKFNCEVCGKTFNSIKGLKGHSTKMHKMDKDVNESEEILMTDEEDYEEVANLEENSNFQDEANVIKKYKNRCTECDFEVEANRKYEIIKIMLRHNENCLSNNKKKVTVKYCEICEFAATSEYNMKRHKRDDHGSMTESTSPPLKRKRIKSLKSKHENEHEDMEIDKETENLGVETLIVEDMDIDVENESKIRSKMMDDKIIAKEKEIAENERLFQLKKKKQEEEKIEEEKRKLENQKLTNKKRKQQIKDEKKKKRKKSISLKMSVDPKVPNIKPVPQNCAHLVNKDDVVYVVPGNGACAPNCASAFLFEDEVFGDNLRRKMNKFMATHWESRYQHITQCAPGHPFVRQLGGNEVSFTDPKKLVDFLMNSEKADRMWSDSEDLSVISDLYQLEIKVITTKGVDDTQPIVNKIHPCENLKEFAELKNVELNEMVLLHEDDSHFNLIISKDSNLARLGSLSYRTSIGPIKESQDTNIRKENTEKIEVVATKDEKDSIKDMEKLKFEIKQLKESKIVLEKEYSKCEQLLKQKTEEAAKLAIELKDLKEIISLEGELKKNMSITETEHSIADEKEYNCTGCCFQGTSEKELDNHITFKHRIVCRNCGEKLLTKTDLMYHRKNKHLETVAFCKNKLEDKCKFDSAKCWWRHTEETQAKDHVEKQHIIAETIKCYLCQTQFESKRAMMIHRKKEHISAVKICNKFQENDCRFGDEDCWFKHDLNTHINQEHTSIKPTYSVFQGVRENLKPPIVNQKRN